MAIELRVLGCFGVSIDHARVDISPIPARILAYLALQPGGVRRSRLARVLWTKVPHARALGNLRSALWRLPSDVRDAVAESGPSLRLADDVVCDLGPLRLGVAPTSGALPEVLGWAWRDELLAGWYDDWVLAAREAFQARRAGVLEELATTSSAAGRGSDALMFATLAVGAQPLRESAHRALLRAHLELGHQSEAEQLYREFARMLHHELGVRPSSETSAVMTDTRSAITEEVA